MTDELAALRDRVAALEAKLEGRETITHLQAERVDVVEPDGQLRLTATNKPRSPETSVDGITVPGRGRPGLLFFNDKGDECGGLSFRSYESGGADSVLTWDRLNQDQVIAFVYNEQAGRYRAGLWVYERGPGGISEVAARAKEIEALPPAEQEAAYMELGSKPGSGQPRLYVGRDHGGSALLVLLDVEGRPRLQLSVAEDGTASIAFLDESGAVEREL